MFQPNEGIPPYMRRTDVRHMSMPYLRDQDELDDHIRKTKQSIIGKNALSRPAIADSNLDVHHNWMVELKELRDRAIFLMTKECILRDECEVSCQGPLWWETHAKVRIQFDDNPDLHWEHEIANAQLKTSMAAVRLTSYNPIQFIETALAGVNHIIRVPAFQSALNRKGVDAVTRVLVQFHLDELYAITGV